MQAEVTGAVSLASLPSNQGNPPSRCHCLAASRVCGLLGGPASLSRRPRSDLSLPWPQSTRALGENGGEKVHQPQYRTPSGAGDGRIGEWTPHRQGESDQENSVLL